MLLPKPTGPSATMVRLPSSRRSMCCPSLFGLRGRRAPRGIIRAWRRTRRRAGLVRGAVARAPHKRGLGTCLAHALADARATVSRAMRLDVGTRRDPSPCLRAGYCFAGRRLGVGTRRDPEPLLTLGLLFCGLGGL